MFVPRKMFIGLHSEKHSINYSFQNKWLKPSSKKRGYKRLVVRRIELHYTPKMLTGKKMEHFK